MPPLDRSRFTADAALDATLDRLLRARPPAIDMPDDRARRARRACRGADAAARDGMVRAVLADADSGRDAGRARLCRRRAAGALRPPGRAARCRAALVPVGDGVCPACGGAPVASVVVGWQGAHGTRFCACSLCATQWHEVRIKCVLCGSTKGIAYQELDGGAGHGQGGDLRELPRLREDPAPAERSGARTGRRRRRERSGSTCCCARPATGAAPSIRSCSAIEARMAKAERRRIAQTALGRRGAAHGRGGDAAIARFGRSAVVAAVRETLAAARANGAASGGSDACRGGGADAARSSRSSPTCARSSTSPAPCCTPISAARCWPRPRSRPRVAAMRNAVALEFDLGGGQRGERDDHRARPAVRTDRRRGRHRRQQQRRRRAARAQHAGQGPRGDRLARRADRDRRRLPHARHHGARRRQAGRGRHHQPHPPEGLCRRDRRRRPG